MTRKKVKRYKQLNQPRLINAIDEQHRELLSSVLLCSRRGYVVTGESCALGRESVIGEAKTRRKRQARKEANHPRKTKEMQDEAKDDKTARKEAKTLSYELSQK